MKKFILLLLIVSFGASAGVLKNRKTGESMTFNYDSSTQILTVDSQALDSYTHTFKMLSKVLDHNEYKTNPRQFSLTRWATDNEYHTRIAPTEYLGLGGLILVPATVAADLALLPFKGVVKLVKRMRLKRDLKKLKKAILSNSVFSDSVVKVSNKRFLRIANLLNKIHKKH